MPCYIYKTNGSIIALTLKKKPTPAFNSESVWSLMESEAASGPHSASSPPNPLSEDNGISIRLLGLRAKADAGMSLSKEHSDGAPELLPPCCSFLLGKWLEPPSSSRLKTVWSSLGSSLRGREGGRESLWGTGEPMLKEDEVWSLHCQGDTFLR